MRVDILNDNQIKELCKKLKLPHSLIWEIGYTTGLRISDILSMKVKQFYKPNAYVKEKKTGKTRRVYLRKAIREKAIQYAEKNKKTQNERLFKVSRQAVWKAFKRASVGINRNVGTHSMRKSYSKKYLKRHNIYELKKRLNHSILNDTIGYITTNEDLGL